MKKKSTPKKTLPAARRGVATHLGSALAHVQDGVDQLVSYGFKKLKTSGKSKVKKSDSVLKKSMIKTADFLGEAGTSFYQKYEEIKEKRRKK